MSFRLFALGVASLSIASVVACGGDDDNSSSSSTSSSTSSSSGSPAHAGSSTSSSGNTATGGGPAACNSASSNICNTFSTIPSNATPASYCALLGGDTVAVPACSTDNVFATCTFTAGGADQVYYYYKSGNFTQNQVTTACNALSGTLALK